MEVVVGEKALFQFLILPSFQEKEREGRVGCGSLQKGLLPSPFFLIIAEIGDEMKEGGEGRKHYCVVKYVQCCMLKTA